MVLHTLKMIPLFIIISLVMLFVLNVSIFFQLQNPQKAGLSFLILFFSIVTIMYVWIVSGYVSVLLNGSSKKSVVNSFRLSFSKFFVYIAGYILVMLALGILSLVITKFDLENMLLPLSVINLVFYIVTCFVPVYFVEIIDRMNVVE